MDLTREEVQCWFAAIGGWVIILLLKIEVWRHYAAAHIVDSLHRYGPVVYKHSEVLPKVRVRGFGERDAAGHVHVQPGLDRGIARVYGSPVAHDLRKLSASASYPPYISTGVVLTYPWNPSSVFSSPFWVFEFEHP